MKNAVLTFTYKGVEQYLNDFFVSLENQTYKSFITIVVNDNLNDINNYVKNRNLKIKIIKTFGRYTPAEIRQIGIEYCIKNSFQNVIFADADDFLSNERVYKSIFYLNKGFDIVFNNLQLVNEKGKNINNDRFLKLKENMIKYDKIIDKNFLGLSNTGLKVKLLNKVIPIPKNIIAVDWGIFSILLYWTNNVKFIDENLTFYRQHSKNIVGANQIISREYVKLGILVKVGHYYYMTKYFNNVDDNLSILYKEKYLVFNKIKKTIDYDKKFLNEYLEFIKINSRDHKNTWWGDIQEYHI